MGHSQEIADIERASYRPVIHGRDARATMASWHGRPGHDTKLDRFVNFVSTKWAWSHYSVFSRQRRYTDNLIPFVDLRALRTTKSKIRRNSGKDFRSNHR